MTVPRNANAIVSEYFGHYLPGNPAPELDDFCDTATFRYFDEVMVSQNPLLRGEERRELIRRTVECLEVVLLEGLGCSTGSTEFGRGIVIGGSVVHHDVWVEKCLSDPVGDSIRAKCAVFFGPQEHPLELGRLRDESCVRSLCSTLGSPEQVEKLTISIVASLTLFEKGPTGELLEPGHRSPLEQSLASGRALRAGMLDTWKPTPGAKGAEFLVPLWALVKLNDFAAQGSLNIKGQMQSVPDELLTFYLERCGKKWPFAHLVAGLLYMLDAPIGPNGDVFNFVWKLWKRAARPDEDETSEALVLALQLIAKKGYHHDISDFKRVLTLVPIGREAMIQGFSPEVVQGCYRALAQLFSTGVDLPYRAKVELVHLLDSSRGKAPLTGWRKKQAKLIEDGHWDRVLEFARWIVDNRQLARPDGPLGWSDDVYKRFRKGADWALEHQ